VPYRLVARVQAERTVQVQIQPGAGLFEYRFGGGGSSFCQNFPSEFEYRGSYYKSGQPSKSRSVQYSPPTAVFLFSKMHEQVSCSAILSLANDKDVEMHKP
jgi:hypothetical protein